MLLPAFDDPDMPDEARQALPDALEERADGPAATMLAALRDYGRAPLARMAGAALERLAQRGMEATAWDEGRELALDEVRHCHVGDRELMLATVRRTGENSVQAALVELEHWESGPVVVGGMLTDPAPAAEASALLDSQPAEMTRLERDDAVVTLQDALEHMAGYDVALPGELCPVVPILARALTGDAHGLGELHYDLPDADERAVEAWMTDFNARPRAERDRVVGPAMDRMVAGAGPARRPSSAGARRAKRKATRTARKRNRR